MDNLKYYSDSLAHDYDMFMPKAKPEVKPQEKIIPMPETKSKTKTKSSIKGKVFTWTVTGFIVLAFFTNIFLRAEISTVGSELSRAEVVGNQLKSEETRLGVELEKKTSTGNLEKQAKELGMQKPDKTQIHYIFNYEEEPQVETANAE